MANKKKQISIYIGEVGSAYVDKIETESSYNEAVTNVNDAVELKNESEQALNSANDAKVRAQSAKDNADSAAATAQAFYDQCNLKEQEARANYLGAKNEYEAIADKTSAAAINAKQVMDSYEIVYNEVLNKKLEAAKLLEDIDENDNDGITSNGGNVVTANNNLMQAENIITFATENLAFAESHEEDARNVAQNALDAFNEAKNRFEALIPVVEEDPNDVIEGAEDQIRYNIDHINEVVNEINTTSEAINNVSTEINDTIAEQGGIDEEVPVQYYTVKLIVNNGITTSPNPVTVEAGSTVTWTIIPGTGFVMPNAAAGLTILGKNVTSYQIFMDKTITLTCVEEDVPEPVSNAEYYYYAGWTQPTASNISSLITETYLSEPSSSTYNVAGKKTTVKSTMSYISNTLYNSDEKAQYYVVLPADQMIVDNENSSVLEAFELIDTIVLNEVSHKVYKTYNSSRYINAIILQ